VRWWKDKSSWSDVGDGLKGTFLGSCHGSTISCSSLPSHCARHTSLPPQPSLLSFHWRRCALEGAVCRWVGRRGRQGSRRHFAGQFLQPDTSLPATLTPNYPVYLFFILKTLQRHGITALTPCLSLQEQPAQKKHLFCLSRAPAFPNSLCGTDRDMG